MVRACSAGFGLNPYSAGEASPDSRVAVNVRTRRKRLFDLWRGSSGWVVSAAVDMGPIGWCEDQTFQFHARFLLTSSRSKSSGGTATFFLADDIDANASVHDLTPTRSRLPKRTSKAEAGDK